MLKHFMQKCPVNYTLVRPAVCIDPRVLAGYPEKAQEKMKKSLKVLDFLLKKCVRTLLPRRVISDNGTQFVSAVMQQMCYLLKIHQSFIPVYHLQANPVERKNHDLKQRLAILVEDQHDSWCEKLPYIRFAMNTAKYSSTGQTAAFLTFGRELHTVDKVQNDLRSVILKDTFVSKFVAEAKEVAEMQQDLRKECGDRKRQKASNNYFPGDRVFVTTHHLSNAAKGHTTKFIPKRNGPYIILTQKSPTSYVITNPGNPNEPVGTYHTSALKVYKQDESVTLVHPLRKRGRPRKTYTSGSSTKTVW
ncbi:hypothetical protein AVEN_172918-1 [Araneus ventricosus]|uniref:Integrase catalytic domain-containing protein n=1 Tax=Araneus ventricosus TaxID=182803 RepID=A0A4Y1ZPS7_ARAVE|nr:hypothetical protein AVEN_172918-1 [Araneus ventricosus]